jgi:hypothetical protein
VGTSAKAAEAYKKFKKGKKAYDYYKLVNKALDEDTRSGALLKLGIKVSMDAAKHLLGRSLSSHPYFTYHKAHFEALAQALDAMSMKDMALDAFKRAVDAADSTADVANVLAKYRDRSNALLFWWHFNLAEPINIQNRYRTKPAGALAEMKDVGFTPATLDQHVEDKLYEWRASWSELCLDSLELLMMVNAEARVAEAAMARYNDKIKKMTEGKSNIGRIAGYAAEQDRQWQIYERMTEPSKAGRPEQAVKDPAAYARQQRDAVDVVASQLSQACDVVLSDAVNTPDSVISKVKNSLTSL